VSPETLEYLEIFLKFLRESPEGRRCLEDFEAFRKRQG